MMNDLIINGIDHSDFGWYWVKRGGVSAINAMKGDE